MNRRMNRRNFLRVGGLTIASVASIPLTTNVAPAIVSARVTDQALAGWLEFRIRKVYCRDETNPEWPGDDEIYLGGTAVSTNGVVRLDYGDKVRQFRDGRTRDYDPPRVLHSFELLSEWGTFPQSYYITLVLVEEDNGGKGEFLTKLANRQQEEWNRAMRQYLAPAASEQVGLVAPAVVIGSAAAAAAATALVTLTWKEIKNSLKDDIFVPVVQQLELPAPTFTWDGASNSPLQSVIFEGHGGKYEVTYDWNLVY